MGTVEHQEVARLGWEHFEDLLLPPTRGGKRSPGSDRALRDYFGDAELGELQRLAEQTRAARARAPEPLGNLVLLPGIMGSYLTVAENGGRDLIWVNLLRLVRGRVARLRLRPDGVDEAKVKVEAVEVDKRTYSRAVLKLRARWEVETYAFDWRKDIDAAADGLAAFIKAKFPGQPVHLVAHSMGGLVSRNFIRRHKELWEKMRGDGKEGGRLIMLGTPNYGSFAIPQVLTGVEKLVAWLSRLDLAHSLTELLEVIDSFVGSYQMLPAPDKLAPGAQAIYRRDVWGRFPVSERHLGRARAFHEELKDPATIDPERMSYIAGCNRRTLSGLEVIAPGEFRYFETFEGDGRVPHALGRLEGVPTYFVEEDHGSLPKNDRVLTAVDEILQRGRTVVLADQPITPRSALGGAGRWYRSVGEYQIGADLEALARRAEKDQITPEEQRVAEETLLRAVMGETRPGQDLAEMREQERRKAATARKKRVKLEVEVVRGDVTKIEAPVVAVGQYKGVAPVSALGALDRALNFWIGEAIKRSMVGGELGQLFFIPVDRRQIAARAVLLAGMGEEGRFTPDGLRYLMLNVTYGISALEVDRYATVLIGAGAGSLGEDQALRGLLFGVCDAVNRLPETQRLKRLTIVELDRDRYQRLAQKLEIFKDEDSAALLEITVTARELPEGRRRAAVAPRGPRREPAPFGPRITIERDGDHFRFSALTRTAVIPVREVEIQSFFPDGLSERLMASASKREQERLGRLLTTTLFPEDFAKLFNSAEPLTLILDRSTAAIPWEMGCFTRPQGSAFLGTELSLTRQFRTLLSPAPGIAPELDERLRVLVIADPAPEPDYQLPGARREGRAVVQTLNQIKNDWGLKIEVIDRIGDAECDPVDILGLILEGGFDVIHYAGHGLFDAENPAHGGWVFGKDRFLTSREIFRARRVPRLVFANACFSAVVNKGKPLTPAEMNRQLAGIAEAFFERGVQNYIGSGWPVADEQAVLFATTFYENALTGRTLDIAQGSRAGRGGADLITPRPLGEALAEARKRIAHEGSTWGAYHHYGQASDLLLPRNITPAPPARAVKPTPAKASQRKAKRKARR